MSDRPVMQRMSGPYEALVEELCSVSGWELEWAEQAADSVLCVLDQRLFCDTDLALEHPLRLRRLLKRCRHHRGTRPRRLGGEAFVGIVADDLQLDRHQAQHTVRVVLQAVNNQLTREEEQSVRSLLPRELLDFWPPPHPLHQDQDLA